MLILYYQKKILKKYLLYKLFLLLTNAHMSIIILLYFGHMSKIKRKNNEWFWKKKTQKNRGKSE